MSSQYQPQQVARSILDMAGGLELSVARDKLQCLMFAAQGLMLADHGRPLIDDLFSASKWGPKLLPLYAQTVLCGPGSISTDSNIVRPWKPIPACDKDAHAVLDSTLREFGPRSQWDLVEWSRTKGGPWAEIYVEDAKPPRAISNDAIRKHFRDVVLHEMRNPVGVDDATHPMPTLRMRP